MELDHLLVMEMLVDAFKNKQMNCVRLLVVSTSRKFTVARHDPRREGFKSAVRGFRLEENVRRIGNCSVWHSFGS